MLSEAEKKRIEGMTEEQKAKYLKKRFLINNISPYATINISKRSIKELGAINTMILEYIVLLIDDDARITLNVMDLADYLGLDCSDIVDPLDFTISRLEILESYNILYLDGLENDNACMRCYILNIDEYQSI